MRPPFPACLPNFPSPQVLLSAAVFIKTHSAEVQRLCGEDYTPVSPAQPSQDCEGEEGRGGGGGAGPGFPSSSSFQRKMQRRARPLRCHHRGSASLSPRRGCMNITMPACRVLNQPPAKCQMPVKYVDELIRMGRLGKLAQRPVAERE